MPGVIPNYREGPTSWPVCGYQGTGVATTITGGQLVHPNAEQPTMVEPQLAGGKDTLGVAANDAAAPRTSQDGANPAVISQQPDIVAVYYGVDIDVTYAANAGCGDLLVAAANGQVTPYYSTETLPSVPASGTAVQNTFGEQVTITITGGTWSAGGVEIGASGSEVTVGAGAGTYILNAGEYIILNYSVAPTWTWSSTGTAPTPDGIVGRCTQPGGVVIATSAVGSARIVSVL
jgi:hypothetical protein